MCCVRQVLSSEKRLLEQKNETMSTRMSSLDEEATKLREQAMKLTTELNLLQCRLSDADVSATALRAAKTDLENRYLALFADVNAVRAQLDAANKQLNDSRAELAKCREQWVRRFLARCICCTDGS